MIGTGIGESDIIKSSLIYGPIFRGKLVYARRMLSFLYNLNNQSPTNQSIIIRQFYQVESFTRTGFGLALCRLLGNIEGEGGVIIQIFIDKTESNKNVLRF